MEINLVKSENLFPSADAQDTLQEYVVFYANSRDMCYTVYCNNIDLVEETEEFLYWVLVFIGGLGIISLLLRKKLINDVQWGKPYFKK